MAGAHTLETPARVVTCAGWKRARVRRCERSEELGPGARGAIVVLADGPISPPTQSSGHRLLADRRRRRSWRRRTAAARSSAADCSGSLGQDPRRGLRDLDYASSLRRPRAPATWIRRPTCPTAALDGTSPGVGAQRNNFSIRPAGIRSTAVVCTYSAATPRTDTCGGIVAVVEVRLRLGDLGVRQLAVEISLESSSRAPHGWWLVDRPPSASRCFSSRRPRCGRDITVPIGTSRVCAASA